MLLKTQLIGIMALLLVFGLLSSFGGFAQDEVLVVGTTDSVTELSPANIRDYWTWHTLRQIAEPLVTFMPESSEITPCLAESWQISDDGTEYTFYLRQGVQFWDGTPFNAEAMKWTLERNLKLDGPSGVVQQIKDIEEITCVDKYTLRIRITDPDATFLARLADPIAPALALSPASTPSDDFANGILAGTGPYKLVEWIPGVRTVYEAFPEYWGGSPKFTTITEISYSESATLRAALEAGDVDVACGRNWEPEEILELQMNPDLQVMKGPSLTIRYLVFNVAAPPFDDVHVRRAIGYAVDREELNNCIFYGLNTPLYSMVPPELWSHVDAFPGRDLGMALSELQEAGYSSGNPLKITLWYSPWHYGPEETAVAEFLKSDLEETGCIEVALNALGWGPYVDRMSQGGLGLFLLGWAPDLIDPDNFLSPWLVDSPEALGTYLNHPASQQDAETYAYFTALLEAGKQSLDHDNRTAYYEDAQRGLGSSAVLIPLWQNNLPTYVIAQSDIEGLIPDLFGYLPYSLIQKTGYYSVGNLSTEVSITESEKLDPLLVDLLMLLAEPAREYGKEELDLLRELIVLPADAGVDADFYVDVLIGVREGSLGGKDLRALAHNEVQLDDIELCRGEEGPPTYNGMSVYTGQIRVISNVPIEEQPLLALAAESDVLAIDPSFINQTDLDISIYGKSRNIAGNPTWIGINSEVLGPGLRGQGVIVGIVDSGIDWDHEGFTNPGAPQTTRLLSLWNQPAAVKRQQAWLNANLAARRWCTTGDDHGTHVAGIAAGDETATGGRFPGVAPRANIVDVRTTFGDRDIIRGVAYVFGVAAVQKPRAPAVVNLSLGSHYGPHDGTRSSEVALAGLTGPGCLIVAAAGNEGDEPIHTDNDTAPIGAGKTGNIELNVPAGVRQANIRIWFDPGNNYSSSVKIGKTTLASAAPGFRTTSRWNIGGNIVRVIVHNFKTNGISGDRMIEVSLRALRKGQQLPAGKWIIELTRPAGAGGVGYYDAWIAYSTRDRVGFVAPTFKELISEPGNSPLIITTGSFDSKSCFDSGRQICNPGRHSTFSSIGPTRETPATVAAGQPGLLKPDISAPGCTIESAKNTPKSQDSPYMTMEGTSMAAPHMTGCAALMLQVNPNLTPAQVLALLSPWFVWPKDALYPAALPDNVWGRGKLCCACDNDGDGLEYERIAFTSNRDGNYEVYVMNADGSNQTRLTNNAVDDFWPTWSPDGKRIAFISERDGNYEVYAMNADGSSQSRLTNNSADDLTPVWSPDGKRIAFISERDGNYEVYVMNADGSSQSRLTNNSADDLTPVWSPDGKCIAFASERDGNYEVYVMNADGSSQSRLANNSADDFTPVWSPDGKRIAFVSERDGNYEIYVMNADGSNQTRLTNNAVDDFWPTWSPDGKRIAFESERDGNYEVYVMNADGSSQSRLTNNSADDWYPAWSPQ